MAIDLEDPTQTKRLRAAVDASLRRFRPFRDKRLSLLRKAVGKHYPNGCTERRPANLLQLLQTVFGRKLAPSVPRAFVSTPHRALKVDAYNMSLAIDHVLREVDFEETWTEAVLDAIFGMAVAKVGIAGTQFIEFDGDQYQTGEVYVCPVYLEDYVVDMTAKRWSSRLYEGNRYRIPLERLKNDPNYNQKLTESLEGIEKSWASVDENDSNSLSAGDDSGPGDDELEPMVELWDLWIPGQKVVATFVGDKGGSALANMPAIRVQDWNGPKDGPYHRMRFGIVPGNLLPNPPAFQIADADELVNLVYRKLGKQAENQRDITTYRGGSEKDAQRVTDTPDQHTVRMDDPDGVRVLSFGGINQQNLSFAMHVMTLAKGHAGNLDVLAGLGAQTDTVGQDRMLGEAANQLLDEMSKEVKKFAAGIFRDVGFYLKNNPLAEIPLTKRVPGTNVEVHSTFYPADSSGDFLDYNFSIQPHSIRSESPAEKLARIKQFTDEYLIPNAPLLQQQGIVVVWESLIRMFADYLGAPEIENLVMFYGEPQEAPRGPVGQAPARPAQRPRDQRTKGGMSQPGFDQVMQQTLAAGGSKADQPVTFSGKS